MGTAHTPLGVPQAAMLVALGIGEERRELLVIGDRTWDRDLVATRPAPFDRMPVVYARAFGGSAPTDRGAVPHTDNPAGRGFALDASAARGMQLPNIEWPDQPIRTWRDRPEPAGFAALSEFSGLHFARSIDTESLSLTRPKFKPGLFNAAHPRLVFPEVAPGTTVWLSGFRADRRLSFRLPAVELDAIVRLGSREHRLAMRLDTIGIAADEGIVQLTYRASARYRFVAGQQRAITLAHRDWSSSWSAPSL
jgi:hypothetical protein